MTWQDPIVEEVRDIRDAYAKRFGYDVKKIVADLIKKQNARAAAAARAKSKKTSKRSTTTKSAGSKKRRAA